MGGVHGDARDVVASMLDFADANARADGDAERTVDGVPRTGEYCEKAVAGRLDLVPAGSVELTSNHRVGSAGPVLGRASSFTRGISPQFDTTRGSANVRVVTLADGVGTEGSMIDGRNDATRITLGGRLFGRAALYRRAGHRCRTRGERGRL
jgi:hypothetical protein